MTPVTIHNLDQVSAQEVFDFIVCHVLDQGEPAIIRDYPSHCVYRTGEGLACAAGCLIPDDKYSPAMENIDWSGIAKAEGVESHEHLISHLQGAHDKAAGESIDLPFSFTDLFRKKAQSIADRFSLEATVLKPLPGES